MKEKIYFYYTNDLHSHFENWPHVASFLKSKKQERIAHAESFWLADIGDHMDRVHPITEATKGRANVELLNDLAYDFATIGNNEGITLSHDDLYHLYDDATFDVICSNLECSEAVNPPWLLDSKIVESRLGVKIGILGLTARFNPYYHKLGWDVTPLADTIERELAQLRGKTDIIILLSHVGINEDSLLAKRFPEIDVIIGSHTHHLLETGEYIDETLLTAGGKFCAHVGEVILTWDHKAKKLTAKTAETTDVSTFPKDLATRTRLRELSEAAEVILDKKIIHLDQPLEHSWYRETKIMRDLTEEMRQFTKADIAMLNAGLLLKGFTKGDITYRHVHEICPHPINACVVTLTGDELVEVVRMSFEKSFIEMQLQGFGFRGEVIGRMIYTGIEVKTALHKDGEMYVTDVLHAGQPIERDKVYRVATGDTFTFGRLLPEIAKSEVKELFLPEFIRDLLVRTLLSYKK